MNIGATVVAKLEGDSSVGPNCFKMAQGGKLKSDMTQSPPVSVDVVGCHLGVGRVPVSGSPGVLSNTAGWSLRPV